MINFLMSASFGLREDMAGRPYLDIFGVHLYLYAIIIVTGMCMAMLLGAYFFKKRGIDPYDMSIYAIFILPLGILGARLYVHIFPWAGQSANWSNFFDFRGGGLGIYGGVVLGYVTAMVVSKIRKQDFRIICDCIMPGLFLAQSIGRWGNFANQEAFGPIITNPDLQWFPFGVFIESEQAWHYATFFYESLGTFIGFVVCLLLLRSKHYRLGWLTAFYGIYYGIVRLLVESLRTDSLFLYIGTVQTDIKISQLVSVFTIMLGIWTLTNIYRRQLHSMYSRLFATERDEVSRSRWVVLVLSILSIALSVLMFVLGGETNFIAGVLLAVIGVYSMIGFFALHDRLRLYCPKCGNRIEPNGGVASMQELTKIRGIMAVVLVVILVLGVALCIVGYLSPNGTANDIVLAVVLSLLCIPVVIYIAKAVKLMGQSIKANIGTSQCQCGAVYVPSLNKFLLAIFPYKVYQDYTIDNLEEWIDPDKLKKTRASN